MTAAKRNNVKISGKGSQVIMFAHGFGCDQNMWRYVTPAFLEEYMVITFDHVGAGNSDLKAYTPQKYIELEGYAMDIVEIAKELQLTDIIFVGHSVASMMGIIAAQLAPGIFKSLILVGPSPSYINDEDYTGGFTKLQIDELLQSLDNNHLGWSMSMAPVIMGNPDRKELAEELATSFCQADPDIARQFARTTFLSDKRDLLQNVSVPALILQCADDVIAPTVVGEYVHQQIRGSKLVYMEATGHCPNLSAPEETIRAIKEFLS